MYYIKHCLYLCQSSSWFTFVSEAKRSSISFWNPGLASTYPVSIIIQFTTCRQLNTRFSQNIVGLWRHSGNVKAPPYKQGMPAYLSFLLCIQSCNLYVKNCEIANRLLTSTVCTCWFQNTRWKSDNGKDYMCQNSHRGPPVSTTSSATNLTFSKQT